MKQESVKVHASDAHLIAIYGTWSWDYWDEVNHPDPSRRRRNDGPSCYVAVCAGSWRQRPSDIEMDKVLAIVDTAIDGMGHAVRIRSSLEENHKLVAFRETRRCNWSGEGVRPGIDFEIISRAPDPEALLFLVDNGA